MTEEEFYQWDNQIEMADGKKRSEEVSEREKEIEKIEKLEEILGTGSSNPYGTTKLDIFKENAEAMGIEELRQLAIRVGVEPISKESKLRDNLINNFELFMRRERANVTGPVNRPDSSHPAIQKIQDLLGD